MLLRLLIAIFVIYAISLLATERADQEVVWVATVECITDIELTNESRIEYANKDGKPDFNNALNIKGIQVTLNPSCLKAEVKTKKK